MRLTDQELAERRQWANLRGYPHWNAYLDAIQRGEGTIADFLAWAEQQRSPARKPTTSEALGVTATERDPEIPY